MATWSRDTTTTIRDNILEFLRIAFENAQEGNVIKTSLGDDWTLAYTWDVVLREPLGKAEAVRSSALAILDVRERKEPEMLSEKCHLQVSVEWSYRAQVGDDTELSMLANRQLADVQAIMRADIYCGGMSLNVMELSNELDLDGRNDKVIGGVALWEVTYRHKAGNPMKLRGE